MRSRENPSRFSAATSTLLFCRLRLLCLPPAPFRQQDRGDRVRGAVPARLPLEPAGIPAGLRPFPSRVVVSCTDPCSSQCHLLWIRM